MSGRFRLKNLGDHPVYSEFSVKNLDNGNVYRVSIRCVDGTMNFCECSDFKTNGLGTCKHVEFVLHHLEGRKRTAAMLNADYVPEYSSMYVRYGQERDVKVRIGSSHEAEYRSLFERYTTKDGVLSDRAYDEIESILKKAKAIDPAFKCYPDALDHILTVIEGTASARRTQYGDDGLYKIISYNVVGNDLDAINQMAPDLVILDEAQRIKNWNTVVSRNVKKISSPYAIVLTGTPLENKLEELVSIVQFVDMFKLGPLHEFLHHHQMKDESGKVVGYKNLNHIGVILKDILLRRTKQEVMSQLPSRMDKNLFVPMTGPQLAMHEEYSDAVAKLVAKWKRFGFLDEKDRRRLMINLNLMRMVCDSTYIVDQETRHDTKIDEAMNLVDDALQTSHRKVVIFSQWERMTRLIGVELKQRKIGFEYLHGGVPSKKREALFRNFSADEKSRVFLSTDAGGVGLNLQAGSLMINMDLPWNPAVLEQRIGRIHRIGQTQSVDVINLISAGTIDERMLDLLTFKSSMAKGILDAGEDQIFMGGSKFKQFMKSVETITQPVAADGGGRHGALLSEEEEKGIGRETSAVVEQGTRASGAGDPLSELLTQGARFLGALTDAMKDRASTENLIASLVQKDASTGSTYLKIPVESEQSVTNAIQALAGFLNGLVKK